jgi:type 1 glutamine amidotransferase
MSTTTATTFLRRFSPLALAAGVVATIAILALHPAAEAADPAPAAGTAAKPLRALLIAGGCCHDYNRQKDILKAGIEARANVVVDIAYSAQGDTKTKFEAYLKDHWSEGYDVVIHDECSSDIKDLEYVNNILDAHRKGLPAVNLHCAMHSYRVGQYQKPVTGGSPDALWFDFIGLQSNAHGAQLPIEITVVDKDHATMTGVPNWTTVKEELYNNIAVLTAHPLAKGKQISKDKEGKSVETETVVAWTNEYGPKKTRVWSTTIGHNNDTVSDARYLDMVTRGLLWSCDKLNDTYLKAKK